MDGLTEPGKERATISFLSHRTTDFTAWRSGGGEGRAVLRLGGIDEDLGRPLAGTFIKLANDVLGNEPDLPWPWNTAFEELMALAATTGTEIEGEDGPASTCDGEEPAAAAAVGEETAEEEAVDEGDGRGREDAVASEYAETSSG